MRVSCFTLEDFLENLETTQAVFDDTVRFSIIRRPVDKEGRNALKFLVVAQASVVVQCETAEYILELGLDCGFDYNDSDPETPGSDRAKEIRSAIEFKLKSMGKTWVLKPGVIDY